MKTQDKESDQDPFLCRCTKCKKFWDDTFSKHGKEMLHDPAHVRAAKSGCMYAAVKEREDHPAVLKIGDRVIVSPNQQKGVVKYLGSLDDNLVAPELYVGVQLDEQADSVHNGVINSKRYFHCPRGHGVIIRYGEVIRINPPEKKPPLKGNYMFPSYNEIKQRRRARSLIDPEFDLGPVYSPKGSARSSNSNRTPSSKEEKKLKQDGTESRDYSKEAPRDLIQRWNNENFGGGRDGEIRARTLYKLYAAYQRGEEYKRVEEKEELTTTDESDDDSIDSRDSEDRRGWEQSTSRAGTQSATSRVGTPSATSRVGTPSATSRAGTQSATSRSGTQSASSRAGTQYVKGSAGSTRERAASARSKSKSTTTINNGGIGKKSSVSYKQYK